MPQLEKTEGACVFCGKRASRGGMSRHLRTCAARKAAIEAADGRGPEAIIHLQVQDAAGGDFWLHLEMRGGARLEKLDAYLRAIWLECCDHRSRFRSREWDFSEDGMRLRAADVLREGVTLLHEYDFGDTSETTIKVVARRHGPALSRHPVYLMARNDLPRSECAECGAPGAFVCMECMYEVDANPVLCEAHAETHPRDEYREPVPLVNSPRLGMCGYEGPADPPY